MIVEVNSFNKSTALAALLVKACCTDLSAVLIADFLWLLRVLLLKFWRALLTADLWFAKEFPPR